MSFYDHRNAAAQRLIQQYGKDATLVRFEETGPAHDPQVTEVEYAVTLVESSYSITDRNESLTQVGDKVVIVSTEGEALQDGDKLEIDGERYNFINLMPLNPGGTVLLFKVLCRK